MPRRSAVVILEIGDRATGEIRLVLVGTTERRGILDDSRGTLCNEMSRLQRTNCCTTSKIGAWWIAYWRVIQWLGRLFSKLRAPCARASGRRGAFLRIQFGLHCNRRRYRRCFQFIGGQRHSQVASLRGPIFVGHLLGGDCYPLCDSQFRA